MTQDISKLDRNFEPLAVEDGLEWYDLASLGVEGKGWSDTECLYDRLPARAKGAVRDAVWQLSRDSAGLSVSFITDAPRLAARWTLRRPSLQMHHMPSTGVSGLDLYVRHEGRWRWLGVGVPSGSPQSQAALVKADMTAQRRTFRLYLPLYNGVTSVQLGLGQGSALERVEPCPHKPIVFYGTSIVQGGCASRPGMAYPAQLGQRLDRPVINLGFSGNGQAEPELADLLSELDAGAFVIDPLPNLQPEQVVHRVGHMVRRLRQSRPAAGIVLVESVIYADFAVAQRADRCHESNRQLRLLMRQLTDEGVSGLHLVGGESLLGDDNLATVDGTHPTDLGFWRMANALERLLRQLTGV